MNTEHPKATVVLPYIRGLLEPIRRIPAPLRVRACFRSFRTLSNILVHLKDPVPPDQRKGVVYRIPCANCDMTYVGQTEYWHICSQPHPMNRESGLLPQVYDLLVKPSVTPDSAI